MLKKVILASALSAALVSLSASPVMAAPAKAKAPTVAVVNLPLIMNELPQAKSAEEKLFKEFSAREQELQKLQQTGNTLGQDIQSGKYKGDELVNKQRELAQLQSNFQLKVRALQEDKQRRSQEEQHKLLITVQKAIDAIAKERGVELVLREAGIAYVSPSLDISQEVIDRVSKSASKSKK